jgi:putative membrane protein
MLYTILKFIHVVSIAMWFGGLVTMMLLNRILISAGDTATSQGVGRHGAKFSTRLFLPALIVTLITGIGMVQVNDLSFGLTWIIWGITGMIASFIIGAVFTGGAALKLGQRAARGEIDAAGIAAAQHRIYMFAMINIIVLLSVIYAMVAKPV